MEYNVVDGNLIHMALQGKFDVISHGCNCFCTMGAGIAPQMAKAFGCDKYPMEAKALRGDKKKLGNIDYGWYILENANVRTDSPNPPKERNFGAGTQLRPNDLTYFIFRDSLTPEQKAAVKLLTVVNSYSQYHYGPNREGGVEKPLDYEALTMCFRKMNYEFKGKHIGLPKIGAGLAGGDWDRIEQIIKNEFKDCRVTVVNFVP